MPNETSALSDLSEAELVQKAQTGDDDAFAELMQRTSRASLKLAVSILRDTQEAEDQVQTSYLSAWRHVGQFQQQSKFSTWIAKIVANQCLMRLRTSGRTRLVPLISQDHDGEYRELALPDHAPTPEVHVAEGEIVQAIRREIQRLPPILRGVLELRDLQELSTEAAAKQLGLTPEAVKSRLLRARQELRKRLEKYHQQPGFSARTA